MKKKEHLPFLIVGQGIAGSLLAWFLEKAKYPFIIIDDHHQTASSKLAAGIINPITGRRFVKSWMIDTLLPFAKQTYLEIGAKFDVNLWNEFDIIRFFANTAEGNNWLSKTTWDGYDSYLIKDKSARHLQDFIYDEAGSGTVKGAQVDLGKVTNRLQNHFTQIGCLRKETFDYEAIKVESNIVRYKDIQASKVIFCEGFKAATNPWFKQLIFESAKGEVLMLKIPNLPRKDIIKKHYFLVPLEEDLWWFGSNYEWEDLTMEPTLAGKEFLVNELSKILKTEYQIVDHLAAVRPVLKDRRPVIGVHPNNAKLGIFNGLGTKGTSIAPYWAKKMVDYLLQNKPIPKEVNVNRFLES